MTGVASPPNGRSPMKTLSRHQANHPSFHLQSWVQQGKRTDLYDNHAEREHIRFPCDRISSVGNLWRSPRGSIFIGHGVHSTNNGRELNIQTSVTVVANENIGLVKIIDEAQNSWKKKPTPFKLPCMAWFA